jgi:toxin ParE1/3/4
MKQQIRRTKRVWRDIAEIYHYVQERSPQSAEKVFDAIERSIKSLLDAPGVGRLWSSRDRRLEGLRVTPVRPYRNYLIFFKAVPDGIEVFRVVHGARELGRLVVEIDFEFDD